MLKKAAKVLVYIAGSVVINKFLNFLVSEPLQRKPFDREATDIYGYVGFKFMDPERLAIERTFGWSGVVKKSAPAWITYLMSDPKNMGKLDDGMVTAPVDVLDARKLKKSFNETGFTLIKMDKPTETTQWRSADDVKLFHAEITPHLQELYPGASRFEFTLQVLRGRLGYQPVPTDGIHIDYFHDEAARQRFHDEYGNTDAPDIMSVFGHLDTPEEEMRVMLGVWKPIEMSTPVCDHPLGVMDASTFDPKDAREYRLHIDFSPFSTYHNLIGGTTYNPEQAWYYYPYQTTEEVLVFNQFVKGKEEWANYHGAFNNPTCSPDFDSRVSVEMRVAVFFPRDGAANATTAPEEEEAVASSPVCTGAGDNVKCEL